MTERRLTRSPALPTILWILLALALSGAATSCDDGAGAERHPGALTSAVRVAIIGDFGSPGTPEKEVAALVKSWSPDFVITVGDNNYPDGAASTIDANIGQYYHDFIAPYTGRYGAGAAVNRFFPALGNHDWVAAGATPYLGYFTLPGNERYYDFVQGPVHLFAVDSNPHEPDGNTATSTQGRWLQARLAASTAPWKIVYFHHPPYSSGASHGATPAMAWPFAAWGASVVLSGHEHVYEHLEEDGIPYFIDGLGGRSLGSFTTPTAGSLVRYAGDYGAMKLEATADSLSLSFVTRAGKVVDSLTLGKQVVLVARHASWRYRDDGADLGTAWRSPAYDDRVWKSGTAELGYGDGDEATVVASGPASARTVTTHFRAHFTATNAAAIKQLLLRLVRDDGAVVYLNGGEIYRSNMPTGSIAAKTWAASTVGGDDERRVYEATLPAAALVEGDNVLAVEVHQANATSSDVSFDAELRGIP